VATRAAGRPDKPRKLVGDFWRLGTQQAGRADRRFQPEPKSSGSALPRSRAAIRFNRASQFPSISTVPSASYVKRSDFSPNFPSKIQQSSKGDFVLPFDLSYELDFWAAYGAASLPRGKRRRRPLPTMKPQSSASRRNSPWTISNCAAPTLRSSFSTTR